MNRLKFYRSERRLSQWELESASNVPRWKIQLIEQGIREADPDTAVALATTLGCSVEQLFPIAGKEPDHGNS